MARRRRSRRRRGNYGRRRYSAQQQAVSFQQATTTQMQEPMAYGVRAKTGAKLHAPKPGITMRGSRTRRYLAY